MSTQSNFLRPLVSITFSGLVLFLVSAPGFAQACPAEILVSSGFTSLASGNTATAQKGVDEWDGDVVKISTTMPGTLTITGTGTGSQSSLYTTAGGYPAFVDSARLGTGLRDLEAVAPAGDYCVQVRPPTGANGNFTLAVTFVDVCHLGDVDDHGDSFLCATPIAIDGSDSGEIDSSTANDVDVFTFTLGATTTVTIQSIGTTTDVDGSLFDGQGTFITADADSGSGANFLISRSLAAGRYYVRVEGANGAYGISVSD